MSLTEHIIFIKKQKEIKITYTKIHHFETNGMLLFVLMNSEYSRVHLALDQFVDIVEASQHHKFHPGVTGNLTYD